MALSHLAASFATTAAGLALFAGALVPVANADATDPPGLTADEPRLLSPAQLPTEKRFSDWISTPVMTLDDQFLCEEEALPMIDTQMRIFYNSEQGNALTQYAVRFETRAMARKAVARIQRCFSERTIARENPDEKFRVRSYGSYQLKDGLTVGAVITPDSGGPDSKFLWSVGRDNQYVTALVFPLATDGKSPKKTWVALSKKALRFVAR